MSKSVTCGLTVYSLLYGVIRVMVDLFAETFSLFMLSHCSNLFMYVCMYSVAVSCLGCCAMTVRSSA